MVQKLMLALTLLFATTWVLAQDSSSQTSPSTSSPSSSSSSQTGMSSSGSSGQTSVEGCLQGSSGNYTLTDKSGTTYQLSGDTSKLAEHVGHEVQITGATSGSAGAAAGSTAGSESGASTSAGGSSAGGQMLTVEKVKHMSKTCKGAGK
jgi:hypothetical protein